MPTYRSAREVFDGGSRLHPLWTYETVKGVWEERFERTYGFWRGLSDASVAKYLDCSLFESGFVRVMCRTAKPSSS